MACAEDILTFKNGTLTLPLSVFEVEINQGNFFPWNLYHLTSQPIMFEVSLL